MIEAKPCFSNLLAASLKILGLRGDLIFDPSCLQRVQTFELEKKLLFLRIGCTDKLHADIQIWGA